MVKGFERQDGRLRVRHTFRYSSSHNNGSGKWEMCLVSKWAIFHFNDYGRQGIYHIYCIPYIVCRCCADVFFVHLIPAGTRLSTIPTPKDFKDAIESLSPEQQQFAKAACMGRIG